MFCFFVFFGGYKSNVPPRILQLEQFSTFSDSKTGWLSCDDSPWDVFTEKIESFSKSVQWLSQIATTYKGSSTPRKLSLALLQASEWIEPLVVQSFDFQSQIQNHPNDFQNIQILFFFWMKICGCKKLIYFCGKLRLNNIRTLASIRSQLNLGNRSILKFTGTVSK